MRNHSQKQEETKKTEIKEEDKQDSGCSVNCGGFVPLSRRFLAAHYSLIIWPGIISALIFSASRLLISSLTSAGKITESQKCSSDNCTDKNKQAPGMLDGQKSETSSVSIIKVRKIRRRNEVVDTFVCFQDVFNLIESDAYLN